MNYTVTAIKKMKSIETGFAWEDELDKLGLLKTHFKFDGHDFGPLGPTSSPMKQFTLYWYPATLANAVKLVEALHKNKIPHQLEVIK